MMRLFLFVLLMSVLMCGEMRAVESKATTPELEPGIGRALARWRAAHYRDVHYALTIELAPNAERLTGTEEIRVTLDDATIPLVLDWRTAKKDDAPQTHVRDLKVNGRAVNDAQFINDHIVVSRAYLKTGENTVALAFDSPISASGSAVTRYRDREDQREYIYTLFVPSDASTVFPCFDQPDLKARFRLSVAAPRSWKVISNTNTEMETMSGAAPKFVRFGETEPLSTYQFAFAAGEFAEFTDDASPYKTHLYVRQSKAERARKELAEIFRLNREGLNFYARYFAQPFPFPKYDLVVIPEFAYGGMEHAGATFLREESILFPSDPTANDLLSRADLMLHEAAHQWFGDLVTMRWFDDLWLKEGFAEFMAFKAIEATLPQYNAWKVFYQRTKPAAYLTDATKGTTPIFQEIPNLSAAKSAYGNIVYRKAPSMLRQAEFFLGAENFQHAIQLYLKEHIYANAEWSDLVRDFERTSHQQLKAWADAWVKRRGMADVRAHWSADKEGRINRFTLTQEDVLRENGLWPMRLKVLLAYTNAPPVALNVKLNAARETIVPDAIGKRRPAYVFANDEDYGYGRFLLDDVSRAHVLKNMRAVQDDFLRALLWGTLWDSVRETELAPVDYIELGLKNLSNERDEVSVQSILGRMLTAFNRYLSDEQQRRIAPQLEELLSSQMLKAETAGLRITYFRAFQSVALTDAARAELKKILRGDLQVPGMTLRTRDKFDIVTVLLARDDKDAPALLEQLRRTETSDDARRYAYAAGAAQASADVKKKYFDAYMNERELAESWIEASEGPFNSIQQSELTLPYLAPALKALPQLKRTRKIFFVNGWLASFLGGQCTERASQVVENFMRETQLDPDLRLKVLEATDGLNRCVRIRAKYARGDI